MTITHSSAAGHAIATHGLCKRFGRVVALEHVELRVPDGAVYVLVGANGAGKSTLFKLLMNLERPDAGTATVCGLDSGREGPAARSQVGYVPDRHDAPYRSMTCARLLRHAASFRPQWDHGYADHLANVLGVPLQQRVGGLSKGETRRLQLVLALAHRPPVLLLDEPTDGLDPVVRRRAQTLLAEHLADTPTTVMIATHHIHEMESLADHVGVLRHGRLVTQMTRDEMRRTVRSYQLEVPDGWEAPRDLPVTAMRRSSAGRDVQCAVVGEEQEVTQRLTGTGARVRQVSTLALEDAALAFLSEDAS